MADSSEIDGDPMVVRLRLRRPSLTREEALSKAEDAREIYSDLVSQGENGHLAEEIALERVLED